MKEESGIVPTPSDTKITEQQLVYAVKCEREDGTKYLVLHPVEINYDEKTYSYPVGEQEQIEL